MHLSCRRSWHRIEKSVRFLIPFCRCNIHLHIPLANGEPITIPEAELKTMGAELHYSQRGGDITFHGPHQAILYPIISLRDIGLGARNHVEKLESTMIDLASLYGLKARRGGKCETGVWNGEREIGAIGVRISSGITSHGLAFNVDPDLSYFKHIVPCGIKDKDVTSLRRETDAVLPSEEVVQEQLVSIEIKKDGLKKDDLNPAQQTVSCSVKATVPLQIKTQLHNCYTQVGHHEDHVGWS